VRGVRADAGGGGHFSIVKYPLWHKKL